MEENTTSQVLSVAIKAGHILLENGAEIARVGETMTRIAKHYGVEFNNFFIVSNGIFSSDGNDKARTCYAKIEFIPIKGTRLDKVVAVNQLSREIERNKYTLEEADAELERIRKMPGKSNLMMILMAGLGSAAFAGLFGGCLIDCLAAGVIGLVVFCYVIWCMPHMSKIVGNLFGGVLGALMCAFFMDLGFGHSMAHMVIGAIISLVPGVAFTNGIRDLTNEDYIAGTVRMLDAIMVFMSIAIGVSVILLIYGKVTGGVFML